MRKFIFHNKKFYFNAIHKQDIIFKNRNNHYNDNKKNKKQNYNDKYDIKNKLSTNIPIEKFRDK